MGIQQERNCIKCGNQLVKCYVDDGFKGLLVKNPEGDSLFSNKKHTNINPFICANCGCVEWYAEDPEKLK